MLNVWPLLLLQGAQGQSVGVSIAMITQVAGVPALLSTTQALLGSMHQFPPQMYNVNGTVSWFEVGALHRNPALPQCPASFCACSEAMVS